MARGSRSTARAEVEIELPEELDGIATGSKRRSARADADGWNERRLASVLKAARAKAMRRDPVRQVRWILEFEGKDLFAGHPRTYDALCRRATRRFVPDVPRVLTLGELRDIQGRIHDGLEALRRGEPWTLEPSDPAIATLLPPPRGRAEHGDGGAPLVWRPVRRPIERFVLRVMRDLAAVGNRLRLCRQDQCRTIFVAVRRQEVCEACAGALQKARVERWRRKNRQRILDVAHAAYVRRERKRTYPSAQVKRFPRAAAERTR